MNYLSLLLQDIKRRLLYSIKAVKVKLSFAEEARETNLSCPALWNLKRKISVRSDSLYIELV